MLENLKVYLKLKLVKFVVVGVVAGYGMGFTVEQAFSPIQLVLLIIGSFGISAGSLSLNTVQEAKNDALMDRTKHRPVATGEFSKKFGICLSFGLMILGLICLFLVKPLTFIIGFSIILMYNGFYTMVWKKKWAFGAVPGAIPGALPITMGFSAVNDEIFSSVSVYLFLLMFLWQMPHFWSLAIRYADDYAKGHFPVLPAVVGSGRTKYHISFYVWSYVLLAVMSPLFIDYSYGYFFCVLPMSIVMIWQFVKFFRSSDSNAWLPFFLITNFSMLVFVFAPLFDKWAPILFHI